MGHRDEGRGHLSQHHAGVQLASEEKPQAQTTDVSGGHVFGQNCVVNLTPCFLYHIDSTKQIFILLDSSIS